MKSGNEEHSDELLAPYEVALRAICAQTGKLFVMVAERRPDAVLELVRSVPVEDRLLEVQKQERDASVGSWGYAGGQGRTSTASNAQSGPGAFQPFSLNATVNIGDPYPGCPHCGSGGYFYCSRCALFSCWNRFNSRQHFDHEDAWCAGCKSWRCLSDDDDDSPMELTAFSQTASQSQQDSPSVSETRLDRPLLPAAGCRKLP